MHHRLKELRKALHLTQQDFAVKLGITRPTYSQFENGKMSVSQKYINLLCATYHVSEDWLVNGNGEMFVSSTPAAEEIAAILDRLLPANVKLLTTIARELLYTQQELQEECKSKETGNSPATHTDG